MNTQYIIKYPKSSSRAFRKEMALISIIGICGNALGATPLSVSMLYHWHKYVEISTGNMLKSDFQKYLPQ
jgi:hypothetical protein